MRACKRPRLSPRQAHAPDEHTTPRLIDPVARGVLRGQSSPGILQSGQQPSNACRGQAPGGSPVSRGPRRSLVRGRARPPGAGAGADHSADPARVILSSPRPMTHCMPPVQQPQVQEAASTPKQRAAFELLSESCRLWAAWGIPLDVYFESRLCLPSFMLPRGGGNLCHGKGAP